ncbi:MAG: hypothetical protein JJ863_04490 [Deltaproteobacteria bacterium]|nr:hypothetical protein [Deltaproteobacteria bacterium]
MKILALVAAGAAIAARALREPWKNFWDGPKLLPQYPVAQVPDGVDVRVRGHLEPGERGTLVAPLTGRACVAYRLRIEVRDATVVGPEPWRVLCVDGRSVPTWLVDPTGRAPLGEVSHWEMPVDAEGGVGQWHDVKAREAAGLRRRLSELEVRTDYVSWDHDVRVQEAIVAPSEPVVVNACGRWERDPSVRTAGYREVGRTLRLEPMLPSGQLTVSKDRWLLRRTPEYS